jgi:hypothetical protein
MKKRSFIVLGICLLILLAAPLAVGQRPILVSVNNERVGGDDETYYTSPGDSGMSADGRYIVANDHNNNTDVFVRDLVAGTTTLVSVNRDGTGTGNSGSDFPSISADGRYIAFKSFASDLVANDQNRTFDVFVRDMVTGTTTLVSVNLLGTGSGNNASDAIPVISANGRFVVFESSANNLVANDNNRQQDLFIRDLQTKTTSLVSSNAAGNGGGNGATYRAIISDKGQFVFFLSFASNLVMNDHNGVQDIFMRNMRTGITSLVSINSAGTGSGNGVSSSDDFHPPVISPDGRFVAFSSVASDLVTNDTNGEIQDVFVRDMISGKTSLVSVNNTGRGSGNDYSVVTSISPDGRHIAFHGGASDLVTNDTNQTTDAFLRDMGTEVTRLVSVNSAGTASGNRASYEARVSADGKMVVFQSSATDIVPNKFWTPLVIARDMSAGKVILVSCTSRGTSSFGNSYAPVISRNGRIVSFISRVRDLVANDNNGDQQDLFAFRLSQAVGDYDGDHRTDIAIWRPENGLWRIIKSSDGSLISRYWGASTDIPAHGDYDGDGRTDLAVWRPSTGVFIILRSSDGGRLDQPLGISGDKPLPADYDGDGRTDMAVFRPGDGTWHILESSTNTLRSQTWGTSEDKPVTADYDQDRKADLVVYRPSDRTWRILRSSDGTSRTKVFGRDSDQLAPADYDGDGRSNIAFFRPENATWYLFNSLGRSLVIERWGRNGDIAQPADYDGDGQDDLAVWQPSTGLWQILKSSDGEEIQQTLGRSGDVPLSAGYFRQ